MFGFKKKCAFCKKEIEKGEGIKAEVDVYGRIDRCKRDFCSDKCLMDYEKFTAELMKRRRPNVCLKCLR